MLYLFAVFVVVPGELFEPIRQMITLTIDDRTAVFGCTIIEAIIPTIAPTWYDNTDLLSTPGSPANSCSRTGMLKKNIRRFHRRDLPNMLIRVE